MIVFGHVAPGHRSVMDKDGQVSKGTYVSLD